MIIKIVPNTANAIGKLAEAEIHFTPEETLLSGLKLIGFSIWERRTGAGQFNVTFPARQYTINGERRSFALLRPLTDHNAQSVIREAIIDAYRAYVGQDSAPAGVADTNTTTDVGF